MRDPITRRKLDTIAEAIDHKDAILRTLWDEVQALRKEQEILAKANSPATSLPYEILRSIFVESALGQHRREPRIRGSSPAQLDSYDPIVEAVLSSINRRWRDIALNTPLLWSHIDVTRTKEYKLHIPMYLTRSRSVPLSVVIYDLMHSCDMQAIVDMLVGNSHRIFSLSIHDASPSPNSAILLECIKAAKFPRLWEAKLSRRALWQNFNVEHEMASQFVLINNTSLTALTMHGIPFPVVGNVIQGAQSLQTLVLCRTFRSTEQLGGQILMDFPQLKSLHFEDFDGNVLMAFIKTIRAPLLERMCLSDIDAESFAKEVDEASTYLPSLRTLSISVSSQYILPKRKANVDYTAFCVGICTSFPTIRELTGYPKMLEAFSPVLTAHPSLWKNLQTISLEEDASFLHSDDLAKALLPLVQKTAERAQITRIRYWKAFVIDTQLSIHLRSLSGHVELVYWNGRDADECVLPNRGRCGVRHSRF